MDTEGGTHTLTFSIEINISSMWLWHWTGGQNGTIVGRYANGSTAWTITSTKNDTWTQHTLSAGDAAKAVKSLVIGGGLQYCVIDTISATAAAPATTPGTLIYGK